VVKECTSLPAQRLGFIDRGVIKEDMWADLVIFDAKSIADTATFEAPHTYPTGIAYVLVNGIIVIDHEHHTGTLPGKALKGSGYTQKSKRNT